MRKQRDSPVGFIAVNIVVGIDISNHIVILDQRAGVKIVNGKAALGGNNQ